MKVILGEKSPVMVGSIKEALASVGADLAGEAWQPQAIFDCVMQEEPDIVLIDLDLPGAGAVVHNLREQRPALFIIGYMAASTAHRVLAARDAGTSEILVKPLNNDRLIEAFEHAKTHLAPRLASEVKPSAETETANAAGTATAEGDGANPVSIA